MSGRCGASEGVAVSGASEGVPVSTAPPDAPLLPPPPPQRRRPQARPGWSVVLVSLAVAVVSLAAAVVSLLTGGSEATGLEEVRQSALDAARERTDALTTYDHRTLDEDVAEVLRTATGEFERDYRRTAAELRPTFLQTKAIAQADVVGAGIEVLEVPDDGPARAVAVVAVDQVITTVGAPRRVERNRLRMELVRPQDTWLVARVERL